TTDGVEKVVEVPVTIQRDTDGDGTPDATDSDDDGDGIPDEQDNNPKTAKETTVTAEDSTVVAGKEITPIPVTVDSDAKNPTVEVTGLPDGLSYNPATNQIEGTPSGKELPEGQDTVDVPATITVTDGSGNPVTKDITITVQRDTDGDGIPDVTDTDDDNDGIPDTEEIANGTDPKTPNTDSAVTPATVVEGQPVEGTKVVTPESPNSVITPSAPVNGVSVDENGKLTGTPDITDWKDDEETREITIPVTVTTDGVEKVVEVPVTIQRDTDGDGQPDVTDTDDDNDGIPDTTDTEPKTPNTDTSVTPATVVEGQPVPDTQVVTPESPNTVITPSAPVNGVSVDENGKLTGTPDITDWKDDEETREITIPVTVTTDGVEKVIEVPVTIQRDTDGDGIPDVTDTDDDNDGIPDTSDAEPKTPNTDTSVTPATVVEGQPVPDTQVVTPESPNTVITPSAPVNDVSVDENGKLTGTPDITDWKDDEETREITIPVTVTTDGVEKVVEVPVTIQRDTDGDGIPDVTDTDDDNDGIPDTTDTEPKTPNTDT
ncbi:TPA: thrombospondin type 3 repeat-containing protein, partial [Streptococcus suis]|nr:thrombospondin type 3 repeat-containing protein [Streptococcus suis]